MNRTQSLAVAVAGVLLVSACGNGDDGVDTPPTTGGGATSIALGETIEIDGGGATATEAGVLIETEGTYLLTGSLTDGSVLVRAPGGTVELVLDGVDITNSTGPAILFATAGEAVVTVSDESENHLRDGGEAEEDAALYAAAPLTIQGGGTLNVQGTYEGISSTLHLSIESGDIHVEAFEDGLSASEEGVSQIRIAGGRLYTQAEFGDGVDSNGTIHISGGTVIALAGQGRRFEGIDSDNGTTIDAGTVVATGEHPSVPTAESGQESLLVSHADVQPPNTLVSIQSAGEHLLTFEPPVGYQHLLFSSDAIEEGVEYDVYSGGTATGSQTDGLFLDGSSTGGTLITSVTTESVSSQRGP